MYDEEEVSHGWAAGSQLNGSESGGGGYGSDEEGAGGVPALPSPEEVLRRIEGFALWFVEQLTAEPPTLPDFEVVRPAPHCTGRLWRALHAAAALPAAVRKPLLPAAQRLQTDAVSSGPPAAFAQATRESATGAALEGVAAAGGGELPDDLAERLAPGTVLRSLVARRQPDSADQYARIFLILDACHGLLKAGGCCAGPCCADLHPHACPAACPPAHCLD